MKVHKRKIRVCFAVCNDTILSLNVAGKPSVVIDSFCNGTLANS